MKGIYALLVFSALTLAMWYSFAGYMIYILGKETGLWQWCWVYIDKWIKWRYGW